MISFDYSNMMADNIGGDHGLSSADLEGMAGPARATVCCFAPAAPRERMLSDPSD